MVPLTIGEHLHQGTRSGHLGGGKTTIGQNGTLGLLHGNEHRNSGN